MDKATELSVEDKLRTLYELQKVHSEIDKIQILRGELPLEVQDLEDEIQGLETRISNLQSEVDGFKESISTKKNEIEEAEAKIKKYKKDQDKVRNNREFETLNKEIEFQELEIELCQKRIKEFKIKLDEKQKTVDNSSKLFEERKTDLEHKKNDLANIVSETQKDENDLLQKSSELEVFIDERLLNAYKRIRKSVRNGLGLVTIKRGACGGCFNKIPPQRQLDVQSRKKIIVCEHCGRVIVDPDIDGSNENAED